MMRGPAKAAGLPALQQFLEVGFDTFKAMGGAAEFLSTVGSRERSLAKALFAAQIERTGAETHWTISEGDFDLPLGQLP